MVAMKIRDMKDNKSPGVDGIPPKLLFEIVEQISIALAAVFNLSLEEGRVPLEWKEANIIQLLKKVRETSQHGFLKARSCLTNILCFLEDVTMCVDEGSPVDIIYLDLKKSL